MFHGGPDVASRAVAAGLDYVAAAVGAPAALDATTGQPRRAAAVAPERRVEARGPHRGGPAGRTKPDARDVFTSAPTVV